MRLMQVLTSAGKRAVARSDRAELEVLDGPGTVYELALQALAAGRSLAEAVDACPVAAREDARAAFAEHRVLTPFDHPDPAHLLVSGTGLTHLGSAAARDRMHDAAKADPASLTDSMRMFRSGLEGGKPAPGQVGAQPEWFYKGDGGIVVAPEAPLTMPGFALDGGEEPELAGLYVIGTDGTPHRLGFALGNEFSDHALERQNYLLLAHSKLRACSIGPELRLGALPADLRGTVRLTRGEAVLWQDAFLSGEANMSHSLANLEHHHFKYAAHRRPGDAHIHFFGTATLSFAAGMTAAPGDVFEIEMAEFGRALRNPLAVAEDAGLAAVAAL